jgi:uroporphyrinogen-III decarboxylase
MGHAVYQETADGSSDFDTRISCPFATVEEALALDPMEEYGAFDLEALAGEFQRAYDELDTHLPSTLASGGVYTTLFSGLIEVYGWEMLLVMMTEPTFDRVIETYFQWSLQHYQAYARTSIPVIISHDDLVWTSGPVTSPAWYRAHIFPRIKRLWEPLKTAGKKILFTCDGDMTAFIDDIIAMGADMIITEPMTDFDLLASSARGKVASFGSFDTRILLLGDKESIQREVATHVERCKQTPGMFFGTGNHIPQNTPVDNVLWYQEAFERNAAM